MNPIQQFVEKYNGIYNEELEKGTHTSVGKYTSQPKWGRLLYKSSKLSVSIDEVSGANPTSELFRMKLILESHSDIELLIYPRSYLSRLWRERFIDKRVSSLGTINAQYKFTGDKTIITSLCSDKDFLRLIYNEYICINISKKNSRIISITPSRGYRSVEHLEKLADTLKLIESLI